MKRLTENAYGQMRTPPPSRNKSENPSYESLYKRLAAIEDILGDEYDLDRLKVIVNQCMTMREEVAERFSLTAKIPLDRLKELVEADMDGRCFILPPDDFPWTIRGDVMRDLVRCNCRAYKKIHEIIQETQVKGEQDGNNHNQ